MRVGCTEKPSNQVQSRARLANATVVDEKAWWQSSRSAQRGHVVNGREEEKSRCLQQRASRNHEQEQQVQARCSSKSPVVAIRSDAEKEFERS